jgi:hypothetical protein
MEKGGGHNDVKLCVVFISKLNSWVITTTVSNSLCPQNLTSIVKQIKVYMHLLNRFLVNSEGNQTIFMRNITFSSLLCTLGFESFRYPPSMESTAFQISPIIQGLIYLNYERICTGYLV